MRDETSATKFSDMMKLPAAERIAAFKECCTETCGLPE